MGGALVSDCVVERYESIQGNNFESPQHSRVGLLLSLFVNLC